MISQNSNVKPNQGDSTRQAEKVRLSGSPAAALPDFLAVNIASCEDFLGFLQF